jgi:hypothetical protein
VKTENKSVLAFYRQYEDERILVLSNLSGLERSVKLSLGKTTYSAIDLISGIPIENKSGNELDMVLAPYQYRWTLLE